MLISAQRDSGIRPARGQPRRPDGTFAGTHRAYAKPDQREIRATRHRRFRYALALGFPSWRVMPAPLQARVLSIVRLEFHAAKLFAPHWEGKPVPRRFDGTTEYLRRQLNDLGLEAQPRGRSVAEIVAAMTKADA